MAGRCASGLAIVAVHQVSHMRTLIRREVTRMGEFSDKIKGRWKSVIGKATGDRSLEAEGELDETKGKAKGAFEDVKHGIKDAVRRDPKPGEL